MKVSGAPVRAAGGPVENVKISLVSRGILRQNP
jgi:hypothetical protein